MTRTQLHRSHSWRAPLASIAALALAVTSLVGCADDAGNVDEESSEVLAAQKSGGSSLKDPKGSFIADVTANGTGCPAGTWDTTLSNDGQTFTTTFSAYEAQVDKKTRVSIKDCLLTVKLHTPAGRSFQVQSFYYQGYGYLEKGVTGAQSAQYYFQGDPTKSGTGETSLKGPYDKSYLFTDDVAIKNPWSPCGQERNLNVVTRLRLNGDGKGVGYLNMNAVDGSSKLVFKLGSRSCK